MQQAMPDRIGDGGHDVCGVRAAGSIRDGYGARLAACHGQHFANVRTTIVTDDPVRQVPVRFRMEIPDMATKLSDADAEDFVSRYLAGETLKELQAAFRIGHPRAAAILATRGVRATSNGVRSRKLSAGQVEELIQRYQSGESCAQIAERFGISAAPVGRYLHRAGIQARPRWHGLQAGLDAADPEILRAKRAANARTRWENASPEQRAAIVGPANEAARGCTRSVETKTRIAATRARLRTSDSPYEAQVAEWLRERGVAFTQQFPAGPYNLDFAVGNIALEFTTGWARKKKWGDRTAYLFDRGWHLYVIWHDNADVNRSGGTCDLLPAVADDFVAWMKILEASPSLRCQHRVIWRSSQVFSAGSGDADYIAGIFKANAPLGSWPLYGGTGNDA
jgi:very-short-patch-repair endonuclease